MEFLNDIKDIVYEAIQDAKYRGEGQACATYNCDAGYIDIAMWADGDTEVFVVADNGLDHDHSNIVQAVTDALPLWDEVEIEECCCDPDGFRNVTDYNCWRYCS